MRLASSDGDFTHTIQFGTHHSDVHRRLGKIVLSSRRHTFSLSSITAGSEIWRFLSISERIHAIVSFLVTGSVIALDARMVVL